MKSTPTFASLIPRYLSRRHFLRSVASLGAGSLLPACSSGDSKESVKGAQPASLPFEELPHDLEPTMAVAKGHEAQVLLRWGDPIKSGLADFDPYKQSAEDQLKRFGYNNDYVGFVPLPLGSENSSHGLLAVNHEFTEPHMMFEHSPNMKALSKEQVDVDIAAHGMSVVEIKKEESGWQVVLDSPYNRRITPNTELQMSGPAAGSERLRTAISKDGVKTLGTYANCAGGVTPWGTILTAEENINGYFSGNYSKSSEAENYDRFGMRGGRRSWAKYYDRWDLTKNPREGLHVGWVVELDPYDPSSKPKKRTALGRCKHEGCNVYINRDERVVAYTGDDQHNEYIYKFVSKRKYQANNRAANMDLLDDGTLYVARFEDEGHLDWLPLVYGQGPLTNDNGFLSQADVCLDLRKAADLNGATPMDRPEDVEVNPKNGHVYAMLTKNRTRMPGRTNGPNPRAFNRYGQIVEFWPEDGDHARTQFNWDLFILAGELGKGITKYHPDISENGWLACPDNCAFDRLGNLWIATDGAEAFGVADGLWACEVDGKFKALTKRFLRTPRGAELCGPFFTPDSDNLFVAVQHPGSDSSFDAPDTRWPDFDKSLPPRPSVVVITKKGGGRVGS